MRVTTDRRFDRAYRDLTAELKKRTSRALQRLEENPRHPGLNFEPLGGRPGFFSIRVTLGWRVLLRRDRDAEGDLYVAVNVGPHDVYRAR